MTQLLAARDRAASDDHDLAIARLERALREISRFPELLAEDAGLQTVVSDAQMRLAWLYLATGDRGRATTVMDEALLTTRGQLSEPRGFGPALPKLYARRLERLELGGRGTIEVSCSVPCRVLVDERAATNPTAPLYLGVHRVWISAIDGSVEPVLEEIDLDVDGARLSYGSALVEPATTAVSEGPDAQERSEPIGPTTAARPQPREPSRAPTSDDQPREETPRPPWVSPWASGFGLAAGVALASVGGILLASPRTHSNLPAAIPLLTIGGAAMVGFGAVLGVDLVRIHKQKGRQAMVTWTLRF
ncbi:tetratricopeptide repeat protein [Enhygromyxa salina]|uniref:tetratricopeptide repeat protein n=1 Tax=Enhygromyxa salina TaxID=215803 RepID=UPI0011B27636|nr:tetratricopeptide repeat protein [Enhygromyxa salina]